MTAPKTLLGALAKALPELEAAKKNAANPHFKSKYADIAAVLEAIRPIAAHGLWFRQVSHESADGVCVETFYIHDTGELSAGRVYVPATKRDAQAFGSAQTYARRYGLQMAFGLATEDDDGNAAAAAKPEPKAEPKPATITEAQLTELQLLFTHLAVPVAEFLAVAKIDALNKLPANWFDRAKAWINDAAKAKREAKDGLADDAAFLKGE